MENECQQIEEMLAAFALDALEIDEREQVEAHLETCETCRLALAEYQTVSEGLMAALPPAQPPAWIRTQLLVQTAPNPQKEDWGARWRTLIPQVLSITAVVAVLVLVIFNVSLYRRTNQLLQTQEQMTQQNQAYQTAFALLTYPNSQVAVIDDGKIYGTLVYDPYGQVAVLNVWGLDDLPQEQAYQVWLIEPDETRTSGGVFQSSDELGYVSFIIESHIPFNSFVGVGVTIEPEGGSPGPTGSRVFGFGL